MLRIVCLSPLLLILLLLLPSTAHGQGAQGGDGIAWSKDLASGLAKARETGRIVMICINAKYVQGREKEERAAKGLREVVYRDPRIVKKSRDLICVLLTPKSSTTDYSELGALGIGGEIVSPQHIFVSPEGDRVLLRREYWSHGKGDKAVEALLKMIEKAEKKAAEPAESSEPTQEIEGPPTESEARAEWIANMLELVTDSVEERAGALAALIKADQEGDCTDPLIALLPKNKRDTDLLKALIRALGRDGLENAAEPISEFLSHKDMSIRANAAVSLEYIGSRDKKVVTALLKAAGKQKDEVIANHIYRALGRCGVKDRRALPLLLKMASSGKSEFATYGPAIGLAYFEGNEKAARGVEKLLKLIGIPGSRRGGGQNTVKRGLVSWTLACIGDEGSDEFVREELMAKLENVRAIWVNGLLDFWDAVAWTCAGDESKLAEVTGGVRVFVAFARRGDLARYGAETRSLMDDSRNGRDNSEFTPKGDNLLKSGDSD